MLAGPSGAVVGGLVGRLAQSILPGPADVVGDLLGKLTTAAVQKTGAAIVHKLQTQEVTQINHDLQTAFRDAFRQAIFDIGGKQCFKDEWREKSLLLAEGAVFALTPEGNRLWKTKDPLADQVCACLREMRRALDAGELLSLKPASDQLAADVRQYLNAESPQDLNEVFFSTQVNPFLGRYASLQSELPDFLSHLRRYLLDRTLVHLGEFVKERTPTWRAFNRLLLEEVREDIQALVSGQSEIMERLDNLLKQEDMQPLGEWSDGAATLITTTGRIEKKLDEDFDALMARIVAQHGELLVRFDRLTVISGRIETKVDRVLRFLENGRFVIEGAPPIPAEGPPAPGDTPFKGLYYFEESDADLFFGREALTAQLINRLHSSSLLAVVGASGSGKSSLVRAGIVQSLKRGLELEGGILPPAGSTDWLVHIITPTTHPLEALAASLTCDQGTVAAATTLIDEMRKDRRSLSLFVRKLLLESSLQHSAQNKRLLLVVDQFEEIFTACKDSFERSAFIDNLMAAAFDEGKSPLILILVLRADFYDQCGQYDCLRAALERHQAYIGPMTPAELRRAIEEPARQGNWQFEPGLVDLILRDVGADGHQAPEPGALPLLSHALLETWKNRHGRVMTLESYGESGGVRRAIAKTAETVYNQQLSPSQKTAARNIFLRLTELGEGTQDTRRRAPFTELLPVPEQRTEIEAVVKILADARLVTTEQGSVEVAHEALIREWPKLREWLEEDREGLRVQRRLTQTAREWETLHGDSSLLYTGLRLSQASEWATRHSTELNLLERQFLDASRTRRERTRFYLSTAIISIIVTLLVAAFVFNNQARENAGLAAQNAAAAEANRAIASTAQASAQEAAYQAEVANNRRVVAFSRSFLNDRLDLALLLGLEAYRIGTELGVNAEARGSILEALQARSNLLSHISGHTGDISSLAFSPNRKILASGSNDATIRVWDVSDPRHPIPASQPLQGHTGTVSSLAFSPDGQVLVSGSADQTVILWDMSDARQPAPLGEPLAEHTAEVNCLVFSPDGGLLASGGAENIILLWDVRDPASPKRLGSALGGHSAAVNSLAFSQDGHLLASGSADKTVRLWEVSDPSQAAQLGAALSAHTEAVNTVAFSPDQKTLASGSDDENIILWDLTDPNQPEQIASPLDWHSDFVVSVNFSPDGKLLYSASRDRYFAFWNLENLENPYVDDSANIGPAEQIAFSSDGNFLASGSWEGAISLWELKYTPPQLLLYPYIWQHAEAVNSLVFSPDGKHMATGSDDETIRLWDVSSPHRTKQVGSPLAEHIEPVNSLAFSPDGSILASGSADAAIRLWDVNQVQKPAALAPVLKGQSGAINCLDFSQDGKILASGSADASIWLWDLSDPRYPIQLGATLLGHSAGVNSLAFRADGMLASAAADGTVILWDLTDPRQPEQLRLPVNAGVYNLLALSPDGNLLALGGKDGSIRLWDISDPRRPLQTGSPLTGHTYRVVSLVFSPDGKTLASGSDDKTVRLWDVSRPSQAVQLGAPLNRSTWVLSLGFSPDGSILASAGFNRSIVLWDVSLESWFLKACLRSGRNLTESEWSQYFPSASYHETCTELLDSPAAARQSLKNAWAYFHEEDYRTAISIFERLAASDSFQVEAYTGLGVTYADSGETKLSIEAFDKALRIEPGFAPALYGRGQSYFNLDEYEPVIKDFELAFKQDLTTATRDDLNSLGWAYYYAGQRETAENTFLRVLDLFGKTSANFSWLAWNLNSSGDYDQAIGYFDQALALDSENVNAWNGLGWCYYELNEHEKAVMNFDRALALDPSYENSLRGRGQAYYRLGDLEKTRLDFTKYTELNDQAAWSYLDIGWDYYNLEAYDLAIEQFSRALEVDPKYSRAFYGRGSTYFELGDYKSAAEDFERNYQLDLSGFTKNDLQYLGKAYHYLDQDDEAEAAFSRAVELFGPTAESFTWIGDQFRFLGLYEKAAGYYDQALAVDPDYADAYIGYGWSYFNQRQYKNARDAFLKASKIAAEDEETWYGLGRAYYNLEDYLFAIRSFNRAVELYPSYRSAYGWRGQAYYKAGEPAKAETDFEYYTELASFAAWGYDDVGWYYYWFSDYRKAVEYFSSAVEIDPAHTDSWDGLGWSYYRMENYTAAVNSFDRAITLDNSYEDAFEGRGYAFAKLNDWDKADADFFRYIALNDGAAWCASNFGWFIYRQGVYEKAVAYFELSLQTDPQYEDAWEGLGYVYHAAGDKTKSEASFLKIIEINQSSAGSYSWIGWDYQDLGETQKAIVYFKKALAADSEYASAYRGLGDIYYDQGNYAFALEYYQHYLQLEPDPQPYVGERVAGISQN